MGAQKAGEGRPAGAFLNQAAAHAFILRAREHACKGLTAHIPGTDAVATLNVTARGAPNSMVGATIAQMPMATPFVSFANRERRSMSEAIRLPEVERLIARAAVGDTSAFRQIYERHRNDVARLVCRMIGPRSDLEDVIQEVFVQVYKSLKDFRGQSKFSTWLHRVTVNVVLMHRRAARSRPMFAEEPPEDATVRSDDIPPDEDVERRERMRAFGRLLDRLADKKRVVFVLHELEGVSPGEIARIVGAPVLTVRTRLFYARREIEAMLAEEPSLAGMQLSFSKMSRGEP